MQATAWRNRLSFGLGTLGRDMTAALVSLYFMFYLTDVIDLSEGAIVIATGVIVATRIFDALNDPVMGYVVDNTRSRFGKFKPWILIGAVLWGAATLSLFTDWGVRDGGYMVLFTVLYLVWSVAYTINDISYWGMLPSLSRDQTERESIGVIARICANVGLFAVVITVVPVTTALGDRFGSLTTGWFSFAAALVVAMLAFQALTVLFTKQRVASTRQATPLRELFGVIWRNDQLLWISVAMLIFMTGYTATATLGIYYFKYIYGNESAYSIFAAVLAVAQLGGLAVFPFFAKRLNRRQLHAFATVLCLAGLGAFLAAEFSILLVALAGTLLFAGQAFIQLLMLMFIADCVEYGQWKLGRRNESITLSLQPFVYKASNALATGLVGIALVWSGISRINSAADLTPDGRWAFKAVMMGAPIVLIAISYVIVRRKYRIDEVLYAQIVAALTDQVDDTE